MAEIIELKEFGDHRGALVVMDREIPFEIKRVYFIFAVPNKDIVRAGHCHKRTIQALVASKGSCIVSVCTKDSKEDYRLDAPNQCLILRPEDWHTIQDFSDDCVLTVLASEHYDIDDYIDEL